jgi:hypothetical protein
MQFLDARRRRLIATLEYGVALVFLVAGIVLYILSSDVSAIALGLMSSIGIGLGATSLLVGGSKKQHTKPK